MNAHPSPVTNRWGNPLVLGLSIGFVLLFLLFSAVATEQIATGIGDGFAWTAKVLGSYFQLLLLAMFFTALAVAFSPAGRARIGNVDQPEISTFKWLAIIMCTLLAGGGVFFAAGEPVAHFLTVPPAYSVGAGTPQAVAPAMAQSFMHWGFLAWAVLGTLTAVVLAHAHYYQGHPLKPRTLLYPVFGEKRMQGLFGALVDTACIIAVLAGTVGPIGFLATQMSFGLSELFAVHDGLVLQMVILIALGAVYITSAITGIHKGIQWLSSANVILAMAIAAIIFVFGPTLFLVNTYTQSAGTYLSSFFDMATITTQTAPDWWLQWWTVFFFAWFIGYGPLMAIFVARISKGRTIRQMILAVAIAAPVATSIWFTLLGGSGIYHQLSGHIDLTDPLANFAFEQATLTVAQALPGGTWMALAILLLTVVFVATTGDSMSYSIAMVGTGDEAPHPGIRAFWGGVMALMAAVLLYMGGGQISVLQQFIVITAIPVSLILLPALWTGPKAAYALAREQGVIASG